MAEAVERYEGTKSEWDKIATSQQFKDLMATKKIFIVPAFVFFVVYYFALPVLVGYAPHFMATQVIGDREHRLSVCPVAVLYGMDHRRTLRQGCK